MADEGILAAIDAEMDTTRAEIAALQSRLDGRKGDLRRLERARSALDPKIGEARAPAPVGFALKAQDLLRENGPLTTAEISKLIKGHRSRAVGALESLTRAGLVRPTGQKREKSAEFELVEA